MLEEEKNGRREEREKERQREREGGKPLHDAKDARRQMCITEQRAAHRGVKASRLW